MSNNLRTMPGEVKLGALVHLTFRAQFLRHTRRRQVLLIRGSGNARRRVSHARDINLLLIITLESVLWHCRIKAMEFTTQQKMRRKLIEWCMFGLLGREQVFAS